MVISSPLFGHKESSHIWNLGDSFMTTSWQRGEEKRQQLNKAAEWYAKDDIIAFTNSPHLHEWVEYDYWMSMNG